MKARFWLRSLLCFAALTTLATLQFGCNPQETKKVKEVTESLTAAANHEENAQQKKIRSNNNLKHIGLGLLTYADSMKALPPAYIADKNGKPLLSWRVLILSYIDQGNLYNQFHLDEPWDSEHNKKLLSQMPEIYKSPGSKVVDQWKTNYLAVRGKDSVISSATPNTIASIADGTSRTIVTVEVSDARAVEWTRPDDFEFNPKNPIEGLVGLREGCFVAGTADCSVTFVPSSKNADILNGWFNKSDGKSVDVPIELQ
jgi:hypothetical protein